MTKIVTIDCEYLFPGYAAAYLLIENGRALFVDNNTAHAVPKLLAALAAQGLTPDKVDYLIITHVHLDHAGGTSALLKHCPNAKVLAHPKAARTIISPEKLVASARKVYGDTVFEKLYGEIQPIDASRVHAVTDGETIAFGSRTLRFFETKGHATHHVCIHDSGTNCVFSGDSFGLRYPALQKHGLFVFPTTSPIDFDPDEARLSYARILGTGATSVYPTHFGEVREVAEACAQLFRHLDAHERTLRDAQDTALSGDALTAFCEKKLRDHFTSYFTECGWAMGPDEWKIIAPDLGLNAAGIAYVAEKRRAAATS